MPWLEIAIAIVMLVGLVGTVVPIWPGLVVVWLAGLVYGLSVGFDGVGGIAFGIMTLLAVVGTAAKLGLPTHSGARRGAPLGTLATALVGALVGAVVLPALGLPIGAVAGVWAAERIRLGDADEARRTTVAIVRAFGIGALVELLLGTVMLATWLVWAVAG